MPAGIEEGACPVHDEVLHAVQRGDWSIKAYKGGVGETQIDDFTAMSAGEKQTDLWFGDRDVVKKLYLYKK